MTSLFCAIGLYCGSAQWGHDVPSIYRPTATQPMTQSIAVLEKRLGGGGGVFAAAQLALLDRFGFAALIRGSFSERETTRIDAASGLASIQTEGSIERLGEMLSDRSEMVSNEARHGLILAGSKALAAIVRAAHTGSGRGPGEAVMLLWRAKRFDKVREIARDPHATGRAAALDAMWEAHPDNVKIALAALDDRRGAVKRSAIDRIVSSPESPARSDALASIARTGSHEARSILISRLLQYQLGEFPRYVGILASDPDPAIRASVGVLCARNFYWSYGTPGSSAYLTQCVVALGDRNRVVREATLSTMDEFVAQASNYKKPAAEIVGEVKARELNTRLRAFLGTPLAPIAKSLLASFGF